MFLPVGCFAVYGTLHLTPKIPEQNGHTAQRRTIAGNLCGLASRSRGKVAEEFDLEPRHVITVGDLSLLGNLKLCVCRPDGQGCENQCDDSGKSGQRSYGDLYPVPRDRVVTESPSVVTRRPSRAHSE